jgi:uncharacterized protein (DUF58 family)
MLHPEDLEQIRRMHIRLGRRVDSPFSGEYRSAFKGRGMEFEDVRPYVPGDEIRRIDWNVTARSGQPYIKEFREERELTLVIVADISASMYFGGSEVNKRRLMARLAGALAFAAVRSGDRVGLLKFSNGVDLWLPPRKGRGHVWSVIKEVFTDIGKGRRTDFQAVSDFLKLALRRRRCTICFLSDFLADGLDVLSGLSRRHSLHALLVHDPLESALPSAGLLELCDSETGAPLLVDASRFSRDRPVAARLSELRRLGLHSASVETTADPIAALLAHFRTVGP